MIVENGVRTPGRNLAADFANRPFVLNPALVDPDAKALIDKYRVCGRADREPDRRHDLRGHHPYDQCRPGDRLGDVIADAQLAYTQSAGAQIAFMNPGGIRADLTFANSPGGEAPGQVTYGEAFTVQPFNNLVTTQTFTGAQIKDVLEQQPSPGTVGRPVPGSCRCRPGSPTPTTRRCRPASRVSQPGAERRADRPGGEYRVTTNDFLANGGDGFTRLTARHGPGDAPGFDVDALVAFLAGPVAPGPANRITKIG